jgi:hypothetical protein
MEEKKTKSIFMKMYNKELNGMGSFSHSLQKCFFDADYTNRKKLIQAFPEFFGTDTAEYFGIEM